MNRQSKKERIRQHYVPQFYLEYFTTAGGIFGLKVPSGEEFGPAPVKSVAYEKFFYDLPQDLEQRFENTLGNLEARFAHSFRVLNASRDLNALMNVHIGALADFVGVQYWRTPKSRDVLSVLINQASRIYVADESTEESRAFLRQWVLPRVLEIESSFSDQFKEMRQSILEAQLPKKVKEAQLRHLDAEAVKAKDLVTNYKREINDGIVPADFRDKLREDLKDYSRIHIESILFKALELSSALVRSHWVLFENSTAIPFLTSDHPVQVIDRNKTAGSSLKDSVSYIMNSQGYLPILASDNKLNPNTLVVVPLSPKLALGFSRASSPDSPVYYKIDRVELVNSLNASQVLQAHRFVYSNEKSFEHVKEVIHILQTTSVLKRVLQDSLY